MQRIIISLLLLAATSGWGASGSVMYRFSNADGDPVYSYTLPPGQVAKGYQKVDAQSGRVLETVDAQLAPELLAEKVRREEMMTACRDELERIYQLYGKQSDIEYARKKALESLDTRISQIQANLRQAHDEQESLRAQAADTERAGRQIPPALLENMRRSQSQIENLVTEIDQRRDEQAGARQRYARELDRFQDGTCPEPGTVADAH